MNEDFETVKVKAGNIDKDGNVNVKVGDTSKVLVVDVETYQRYFGDPSKFGTEIEVTNEGDIAKIKDIEDAVNANINTRVRLKFPAVDGEHYWYYDIGVGVYEDKFAGLSADVLVSEGPAILTILISKDDDTYYLTPNMIQL